MAKFLKEWLRKIILISMLLVPLQGWSISNIENNRLAILPEGFSGKLMASIDGKNGNSKKQNYSLSGKLNYKQLENTWMALLERNYGKANELVNDDTIFWHGRLTHDYTPGLASEMFIQYEEDEFTRLQSRALLGGGLRRTLNTNKENLKFAYGAGAFREKEKIDLVSNIETEYSSRLNLYYVYKHALNSQVTLSSTVYYQPAFSQFSDYRVLFNLAMKVRLNKKLALQIDYQLRRDNQPPENSSLVIPLVIKKTDSNYKTSIVYEF